MHDMANLLFTGSHLNVTLHAGYMCFKFIFEQHLLHHKFEFILSLELSVQRFYECIFSLIFHSWSWMSTVVQI